jgi:hypothetical protein
MKHEQITNTEFELKKLSIKLELRLQKKIFKKIGHISRLKQTFGTTEGRYLILLEICFPTPVLS